MVKTSNVAATGPLEATAEQVVPATQFGNRYAVESTTGVVASNVAPAGSTLMSLVATNILGTTQYVKLYNQAAAPVVASDIPVLVIAVPTGGTVSLALGELGIQFPLGIGIVISAGSADNDATNSTAKGVRVLGTYL